MAASTLSTTVFPCRPGARSDRATAAIFLVPIFERRCRDHEQNPTWYSDWHRPAKLGYAERTHMFDGILYRMLEHRHHRKIRPIGDTGSRGFGSGSESL